MTNRERFNAIMHYENYDRVPVVHFGYWNETLDKWYHEGHLTEEEAHNWYDGSPMDKVINEKLGFDFGYYQNHGNFCGLFPAFEPKLLEVNEQGEHICLTPGGLIEKSKPGVISIPATVGTLLKDRESYDKEYKWRLQPCEDRIMKGGIEYWVAMQDKIDNMPLGLHLGSLYGTIRDMLGVEALSYLYYDDEELYAEIINSVAEVSYYNLKRTLELGMRPDIGHYWEDICFKNGPLVNPKLFKEFVGPHYKRSTDLLREYGCDLVSLDCDGCIDLLVPIWLENGVNVMFPIEVGTWGASIKPWREKYGKEIRGLGGMDKRVFAQDYAAVDKEIERLKELVELGGYIPCPDHRIAPDAKWENVQYYCEQFRKAF